MAIRRELENGISISSDQTVTTSTVKLLNDESLSVQFEGDTNSVDLSFEFQVKVDPNDEWSNFDNLENINLTNNSTNNKVFQFDVLDLERFRIKITNNADSSTTLTVVTSQSDQQ